MENQVKKYELGKDLEGYREIIAKVTSDNEEQLNEENYNKSKEIIESRLNKFGTQDYNIGMNKEDGTIYLQIPENSQTDHVVSNLFQVGKFEIKDSEDASKVFLSNDNLEKVSAVYNTETSGTIVYLQFEFNKEGTNILKELSTGEYATKEENDDSNESENTESNSNEENSENADKDAQENNQDETEKKENNDEQKSTQKKITLSIDDNDMITTSFDDPIEDGLINLSMNAATSNNETISRTLASATTITNVFKSGKMPLTYEISQNNYIKSDLSKNIKRNVMIIVSVISIIVIILFILKYKTRGIIAAIAYVGLIAVSLLVVRYTNVGITLESIVAGIIILVINYLVISDLLKIQENDEELKKKLLVQNLKQTIIKLIPIFIISLVFSFTTWLKISTFGMFTFWGLALCLIYNYTLTKNMLDD